MEEGTWDVNHPGSELPLPNGNPARPVRARRVPPGIRSVRPAASLLGSCRIVAGLSSLTAALRPASSSRRSGASCFWRPPSYSRDRLRDPGIGHVGQWDRLAVEYAGWVRIVGTQTPSGPPIALFCITQIGITQACTSCCAMLSLAACTCDRQCCPLEFSRLLAHLRLRCAPCQ